MRESSLVDDIEVQIEMAHQAIDEHAPDGNLPRFDRNEMDANAILYFEANLLNLLKLYLPKAQKLQDERDKALELLGRVYAAMNKPHWQQGETEQEVAESINDFLCNVKE